MGGWVATQHLARIQALESFAKHIDKYVFDLSNRIKALESCNPRLEDDAPEEKKEEQKESSSTENPDSVSLSPVVDSSDV